MTNDLVQIIEYGPAMEALTELQRAFVNAYFEHPSWTQGAIAQAAGYSPGQQGKEGSSYFRMIGANNMHNPNVLAAMDEEANRRMREGGVIGTMAVVKIAMNETHKDHLKASLALMDRTGRHATTEHKVIVDDKRPQTKRELIDATMQLLIESGLDIPAAKEFVKKTTGEDVIDGEFTVIEPATISAPVDEEELARAIADL